MTDNSTKKGWLKMTRFTLPMTVIVAMLLPTVVDAQSNCHPSRYYIMRVPLSQGMLNEVNLQWSVQDNYKTALLQYAMAAPTENLWREYKRNRDPFVRWAAAVEINRRWRNEQSILRSERKPQPKEPLKLLKSIAK